MKLYYSPGACATASHIAALELGIDLNYEKVDLSTKKTETGADFRTVNPLGYVPALALDDGSVLTENVAILSYLDSLSPAGGHQGDVRSRTRLLELLSFLSSELHKAFGPFFGPLDEAAREAAVAKLGGRIDQFERFRQRHGPYLLGERFSVADAYAFVVFNWAGMVGVSLDAWPGLQSYLKQILSRPAVTKALADEGLLEVA